MPSKDHDTEARPRVLKAALLLLTRYLVLVSGALIFVGIAASFRGALVSGADTSLSRWIAETRPAWLSRSAFAVTQLGNGGVLAGVAALGSVSLFFLRYRMLALYVAVSALGAGGLNTLLKVLFARERPDNLWQFVSASGYSFPSGHAMASAAVYGSIAIVLAVRFERSRHIASICCGILVLAIGLSRVILGVHYLTDVVAGWALGLSWPIWLRPLLVTGSGPTLRRRQS